MRKDEFTDKYMVRERMNNKRKWGGESERNRGREKKWWRKRERRKTKVEVGERKERERGWEREREERKNTETRDKRTNK